MVHWKSVINAAGLLAALAMATAQAAPIPYATPGTQNAQLYTFTAASTGSIGAYFYARSGASYDNQLTMLVNGVATGIQGLDNHTSVPGDFLDLGNVTAGDVITFKMVNLSPGNVGPWYSDKSLNSDKVNHIYSAAFSGTLGTTAVTGTYVGFEDLQNGGDFNYTDEQFVFTNVRSSADVPEPGSLALVGLAIAAAATLRRRTAAR